MKYLKYLFLLPLSVVFIFLGCSSSSSTSTDTSGNWVYRGYSSAQARDKAITFTIGDTVYIGTGHAITSLGSNVRFNDLWSYNVVSDIWTAKSLMPSAAGTRSSAVGFSIGNKGYIATGYDYDKDLVLSDNWEWDQATNTWSQKASLPLSPTLTTTARYDAVAFSIGDTGYLATGTDNNGTVFKDMWAYNPKTDSWKSIQTPSALVPKSGAVAFVYNGEGYIVTGFNNGSSSGVNDFVKYKPSTGAWTVLRNINNSSTDSYDDDYTDIVRGNAVGFVLKNNGVDKAYIMTGDNGSISRRTWEYDFTTDLWTRKTPFETKYLNARTSAIGFVVKGRGFICFGNRGGNSYAQDFCEWRPDQAYNEND